MFRQVKRRTAGRRNFEDSTSTTTTTTTYTNGEKDSPKYLTPSALYASRLSFYDLPPTQEITLEEFETWAIDRLKILIEIESCLARSKTLKEIETSIKPLLLKYLPLNPTSGGGTVNYEKERMKDHYSHFILRLVLS